jgi:folate-dependent phosphoribosylglycinamide formyltransferase PurN
MRILFITRLSKQSDNCSDSRFYYPAQTAFADIWLGGKHDVEITVAKPDDLDFSQYDLVVSWMYPYILRKRHLSQPRHGFVNDHISFLPYGRGSYPNAFAIIQNTPVGATIHKIDKGIDTGNILAQKCVDVSPIDTGQTLYHKLEQCAYDLWREYWPVLESLLESTGALPPGIPQDTHWPVTNRKSDIDEYDDLETYIGDVELVHDVIDIVRARTFPPYNGAFIRDANGRKIYLELKLRYDENE